MDIKSLKDKILQLAIQGKLVPQNENDEPASVLLENIKAEKEQLIKDKVIRKEKPLPEINEEEKLFEIPNSWECCRLGDIINISSGKNLTKKSMSEDGIIPVYGGNGITGYHNDYNVSEKTIVIGRVGFYCGSIHLTEEKAWVTDNAFITSYPKKYINREYLIMTLKVINLKGEESSTAQPVISGKKIYPLIIPIPPLEEQKRIVAKVDELFELIDELDNNKQELLENISNTRNKVLQLAIQGKLVEQCEDDEPASVLLERIKAEKEQLIKDKIIKKEKALPEITEEEKSFELPDTWKWCRLDNISAPENYSFVDGPFGSNLKREHYVDYGVRIIQLQNIGEGFWKDYNKIYTSIEKADELIRCNAFPGELVIAKMNPIARATIIPDNDKRYVLCSDCVKLKSYKDIDTGYLKYLMNSSYIKEKASEDGTGTTRQRTSLGKLKLMPIPLPPQEEQKRIVEKVDLIMNYLDTLQQEIESQEIILEDILK